MQHASLFHVLPAVRGWKVHAEAIGRAISVHERRDQAIRRAIAVARIYLGRVIVHDEQGAVIDEHRL